MNHPTKVKDDAGASSTPSQVQLRHAKEEASGFNLENCSGTSAATRPKRFRGDKMGTSQHSPPTKVKDKAGTSSTPSEVQLRHAKEEASGFNSEKCSGISAANRPKAFRWDKTGTSQHSPPTENVRNELPCKLTATTEYLKDEGKSRVAALEEFCEDKDNKSPNPESPVKEKTLNSSLNDTGYGSDFFKESSYCLNEHDEAELSRDSGIVAEDEVPSRHGEGVPIPDELLIPLKEQEVQNENADITASKENHKSSQSDVGRSDGQGGDRVKSSISRDSGFEDGLLSPRCEKGSPIQEKLNTLAVHKELQDENPYFGHTIPCSQRDEDIIKYQLKVIKDVGADKLRAALNSTDVPDQHKMVRMLTCKCCFERPAERLPIICRHFALCAACANETKVCPVCEKTFTKTLTATF